MKKPFYLKKPLAFIGLILPLIIAFFSLFTFVDFESQTFSISNVSSYIGRAVLIVGILSVVVSIVYISLLSKENGLERKPMFSSSWKLLKENFWKYFLLVVLVVIFNLLQSDKMNDIVVLVFGILGFLLSLGVMNFTITLVNNKSAGLSAIFVNIKKILKIIAANILGFILVLIAIVFFVIPGIYVGYRLSLVSYLILEQNLGPIEAIKKSWAMTKNKVSNLLALNTVLGLIIIVGLLPLGLGIFWTAPLFYLVNITFYKKLLALEE